MENEIENLDSEKQDAESSKISVLESVVFITISAMADFADIIAVIALPLSSVVGASVSWIPILGQLIVVGATGFGFSVYLFAKAFSWFIWSITMIWATFRTNGANFKTKRVVTIFVGKFADGLLGFGIAPIQTISVIMIIFLENSALNKKLGGALKIVDKFV